MSENQEKNIYRQICREAAATGISLAVLICFWLFAGFGLANVDCEIFGMPLWAFASSIGVWCFAILTVKFLLSFVFKDMDLAPAKKEDQA